MRRLCRTKVSGTFRWSAALVREDFGELSRAASFVKREARGAQLTHDTPLESYVMTSILTKPQDAQKARSARPQREKTGGVASGAHGATNKEHHVCARRRVVRRPGPR